MTVYYSYDANNVLKLRFDDYKSSDIAKINYNDPVLYIENLKGYSYSLNFTGLTQANVEFADGFKTLLKIPASGVTTLTGTDGSEWILGSEGADTYEGKKGSDAFFGGAGNDIYKFSKGDGIDIINDFNGSNVIRLSNVKSTEVNFSLDKGDLNIRYGTDDIIKIPNFLANNRENFSIEFSDGTVINHADLDAKVGVQYWVRGLVASTNTDSAFQYIFPSTQPEYVTSTNDSNEWAALPEAAQTYLKQKFDEIAGYTGLTFTETTNPKQANVISAQLNTNKAGNSGYAYYPGATNLSSDIFFDKGYGDDPLTKTWQKYVFPHELGHAVGLRHSFDAPTKAQFSDDEESTYYTTMSYTNRTGYNDGNFKDFDIAALQAMYGVNTTQRTTNDSYQFSGTKGVFVWDGAGIDTIDASQATVSAYIDLNQGSWSYLGAKSAYISSANQLTINLGTTIENATGGTANDTLIGNTENNVLNGGKGADTLIGGQGDDTYYVDDVKDKIIEYKNEGIDTVYASVSYSGASAFIDHIVLTGVANINATGNVLANTLTGNIGNNILNGGVGADTLIGGQGDDTYYVDDIKDKIIEYKNEGIDTVYASVSYSGVSAFIDHIVLTGVANINATGNVLANKLTGNTGNNILNGGVGADTLIGGQGDDTYYVDHVNDKIIEYKNEGIDTVYASVSYSGVSAFIDHIVLTGVANINATGNVLANTLTGNSGNNILNGGAGNDTLIGGSGSDTAIYNLLNSTNNLGGNGQDTWTDFTVGNINTNVNADKIDVSDLLIDFTGDLGLINVEKFLTVKNEGGYTQLYIDRDGSANLYQDTLLLSLNNVSTNLSDLLQNQQLILT